MKTTKEVVTYTELARRVGDMLLCNKVAELENENLFDNLQGGNYYDCACEKESCDIWNEKHEKTDRDIYQFYLINDGGANYLIDNTNEIVFYSNLLDTYVWGITHLGTSWDYVTTEIEV